MAQSKILVDTNAYLRMAKSIHPLLFTPFGAQEYCLYILPELNQELGKRKLQTKFPWIDDPEFVENRQHFPKISRQQKKTITQTLDFVWNTVQTILPGPSRIDALYVSYSIELDIPLVTDDQDMTDLAKIYEVEVISTLQLLRWMLDAEHIELHQIKSLFEYWMYLSDLPSGFHADRKRLFPSILG